MRARPNLLSRSSIKASGFLALSEAGLNMSMAITPRVRRTALWMETDAKRQRIEEIVGARSNTQVVINPEWIELSPLMAYFQAQDIAHRETTARIALRGGDVHQVYERAWAAELAQDPDNPEQSIHVESQQLYLVGFQDRTPIGFVKIRPEIHQRSSGDVDLDIHLDMAYVSAKLRDHGYGVDLAVATSTFAKELLSYVHEACDDNQRLQVHIAAESISTRGQMFLEHVGASTKKHLGELDANPQMKRPAIRGFTCHR